MRGSVQALSQALVALSNDDIRINVIHSGVGGITESDANSAAASKATVIGFNVRADASARRIIESTADLRYFSIIYDVIDQVKQVASGLLGVEIREEIIGIAEVRDVFRSSKLGAVAGSMVIEGVVKRNKPIPRAARQRGDLRGRAGIAASLQGERRGSPQRYRMRYRGEGLQRRQAG